MSDPEESKGRKEVFEHSYAEVLAALKHQDDKLNRTLTALAFLTVAGVALFPKITGAGIVFNGAGPGASAVLFVSFLASVALGVIVTLTAIGPGRPLPNAPSEEARAKRRPSLIFYARISRDKQWDEKFTWSPAKLAGQLAADFHCESKVIAERVDYKVARAREAIVWVELAIVALALMGIFGASGLSASARWWVASGLTVAVLAIPLWDLPLMRATNYVKSGEFSVAGYWILLAVVIAATAFLVVGQLVGAQWQALGYAAVAFIFPRYAIVRSKAALPMMVVGLVAAVPALLLIVFLAQ